MPFSSSSSSKQLKRGGQEDGGGGQQQEEEEEEEYLYDYMLSFGWFPSLYHHPQHRAAFLKPLLPLLRADCHVMHK